MIVNQLCFKWSRGRAMLFSLVSLLIQYDQQQKKVKRTYEKNLFDLKAYEQTML